MALDIADNTQRRALLLHYTGSDVYDIFDTLQDTGAADDYDTTVAKLNAYFCPKVNTEYETYIFRQARQTKNETSDDNRIECCSCCT